MVLLNYARMSTISTDRLRPFNVIQTTSASYHDSLSDDFSDRGELYQIWPLVINLYLIVLLFVQPKLDNHLKEKKK